ncbi:MAG: hypothetical protein Q8P12_03075 [bacterium]|nr:hypothetical protein [bacterium]
MRWIVFFFLFFPLPAGAVLIHEIAWMGSSVPEIDVGQHWRYEWLELYNEQDFPVSLAGWGVELYRGQDLYFAIPLQGVIPSQGYFLAGASAKIPGVDVDYANLGGKFVNEGMRVVLRDGTGAVEDSLDASGAWSAGDNESKRTMERVEGGWQTSALPGGTPKEGNSVGLKEVMALATKKDPGGSFLQGFSGVSSLPLLPAVLLSLGLALAMVRFRRALSHLS